MTSRPRTLRSVALAAGLLALTGCSFSGSVTDPDAAASSGSSSSASAPAPSAPAPSPTGSPAPSSPSSSSPAPAPAAGTGAGAGAATSRPPAATTSPAPGGGTAVDRCHTSELTGSLRAGDAAAGNRYATLVLTDTGGQTCTIDGHGGLGLVDGSGRPLPTTQVRTGGSGTVVTLRPGASVSTQLHWSAVPGTGDASTGACQPTPATLRVIPPDETDALSVPWAGGPVCSAGTIEQGPYGAA